MTSSTHQMREALARRLTEALGQHSIGWLAEQLASAGARDSALRGVTEGSLRMYLSAKRSASLEILRAASEILGVDFAWLATGELSSAGAGRLQVQAAFGERGVTVRPTGFQLAASVGRPGASGEDWETAFATADPLLGKLDREQRQALMTLAADGFRARGENPTAAGFRAAGKATAAGLRIPAELMGAGDPVDLDRWQLARYVDAYLTAARLGVPRIQAGGRGRTTRERRK